MKKLYFQQITDDRYDDDILNLLNNRVNKIKELLNIKGIDVICYEPKYLTFPEYKNIDGTISPKSHQYRVDFYVTKSTRKVTWNDIYKLVNSVKAVPYKFV